MNDPKTIARAGWDHSWTEVIVVYGLTVFVSVVLLNMHLLIAMVAAPAIMVVLLLGVMLFVQLLWMLVLCLERIGSACGIRKSPLS
ncbi:MAG: hypothetical protein KDI82_12580 [Gammaproteobacteria bacterium]|nr:hypothetical protein [Gammaproteobacteria bacterium]